MRFIVPFMCYCLQVDTKSTIRMKSNCVSSGRNLEWEVHDLANDSRLDSKLDLDLLPMFVGGLFQRERREYLSCCEKDGLVGKEAAGANSSPVPEHCGSWIKLIIWPKISLRLE